MYREIKQYIAFTLAVFSLIFCGPLLIIIMILIRLTSPGPVFFRQKRIGINKSHFYIYKFRTMKINTPNDVPTHELENPEQYITALGKFLRRTSLDELPQILNILKGDMCFIGPRPALWNQYDLISEREKYGANNIKPGITGWAQINGRDELEIPLKAELDGEYVRKMSLLFDFKCFYKTFLYIMMSKGITEGRRS